MDETEEKKSKLPDAKVISKIFKFVAAAGIIACAVLKWLKIMPDATAGEIILIWAAVYGVGAGTIDLNIIFDKFIGGKSACKKEDA